MAQKSLLFLALSFAVCVSVGYARAPKKIIDGDLAALGEFPHQVSLQVWGGYDYCGGSIISPRHILTAAHCLFNYDGQILKDIEVVTGTIDKFNRTSENVFPVIQFVHHFDYYSDISRTINDVAILKVDRSIPFNDYQHAIKLPTETTSVGTSAITSGWGIIAWRNKTVKETSQFLRKTNMTVISSEECSARNYMEPYPEHLCAVGKSTGIPCSGDSGGALVSNGEIIGIASHHRGCLKGKASVYMKVNSYVAWINQTMTIDLA